MAAGVGLGFARISRLVLRFRVLDDVGVVDVAYEADAPVPVPHVRAVVEHHHLLLALTLLPCPPPVVLLRCPGRPPSEGRQLRRGSVAGRVRHRRRLKF
eukprot:CAMPEP_0170305198 /NCGR_PEP_ID=MMETSP0116_2-20130129/52962_1 /TAXON_ID=400756 /ORGANISM="Durinskia baltica, Strain CSIRO CS-38" /LENGTH=98 /DNA_ID=CAMNT_0010557227 /DNA_START=19 /DNA_END=312 /DNA_ORIENTATION=+